MKNRNKIKFELTAANNGYILGLINNKYGDPGQEYYKDTWVGEDFKTLFSDLVSQLVVDRIEK